VPLFDQNSSREPPILKSDLQLYEEVAAELKWGEPVEVAAIGVEVNDGIVTLAGNVRFLSSKYEAECAALRVYGVKAVVMRIDVDILASPKRTDAEMVHLVREALGRITDTPSCTVRLKAKRGTITLSGEVEWEHQRSETIRAVRKLPGVQGVVNRLTIRSAVSPRVLKSHIEAVLKRGVFDTTRINVAVQGSEVTLDGSVHTRSARDFAEDSAWTTPGVRIVIDRVTVVS
jgi:osmotically-inducible protein OsmY